MQWREFRNVARVADRLNLGELCRRKVLLFTREAAAIVHEVSTRLSDAQKRGAPLVAPTADQLSVRADGELLIEVPVATDIRGRDEMMAALASLIERLLPPTLRDQPDYAVPGSFRVLAPRARGWPPGLPPLETPGALATAVSRYRAGDTRAVLRHLYARAAPAPATAPAPTPKPTPSTPVATARAADSRYGDWDWKIEEGDFDLPLRTSANAPAVSEPPRRRVRVWRWAAGVVVLALAIGYAVTDRTIRSEIAARISESAIARRIWDSLAVATREPASRRADPR